MGGSKILRPSESGPAKDWSGDGATAIALASAWSLGPLRSQWYGHTAWGAPAISFCFFPSTGGRKAICLLSDSEDELPVLNQTLLSQCKSIYL